MKTKQIPSQDNLPTNLNENKVLEAFVDFLALTPLGILCMAPTILAISISSNTPPVKTPTKEDFAYQQTMQKLYEPVGNGGALAVGRSVEKYSWPTMQGEGWHPSFSQLAALTRDVPQRSEMYQKMDKYYQKISGGK